MARLLRRVETIVPRRARDYGGKARNLAALARAGFPVPAAWAASGEVCSAFLRGVLDDGDHIASLLAEPPGRVGPARLAAIADRIRSAPLPGDFARELDRVWDELERAGVSALAVRSSSTQEDRKTGSAAGLHETVLDVRSKDALHDAVRSCWASLYQPRVLTYLRRVVGAPDASMGVVVQAMVPADASGVLFTVNPLTGDPTEMLINAAWGLGKTVVDGLVSPDSYRVDHASGELRDRVIGEKERRIVATEDGLREESVEEERRSAPALGDAVLEELVRLGQRVEEQFGAPQDVEFAVLGRTIYLLQARPVSAIAPAVGRRRPRKREDVDRSRIVWSNVNVGEALPGVATPLTWSILSRFSEHGFRTAFGSLGCSVPRDAELVGNFRGRIYLNMSEFMAILSQVPGLRPRTVLSLGGGGEVDRLEADVERRSSAGFWARLPFTATRFVRENFRLSHRVRELEELFEEERGRYQGMDLRVLPPVGLDKTLRDVEQLLEDSGSVMLTCYGNLLGSVVLFRGVLRLVARTRAVELERELLTGLADVESAAPGLALWHIAEAARTDAPARDRILETPPGSLRVEDLPDGSTRRALARFITTHGFRGPREAEIATPRWREDPSMLFAALRAHLSGNRPLERSADVERRQREVRERAAGQLDRLVPTPVRPAVRRLLVLVQRFTRLREHLRSYVTEVLGMYREVALDASRRLVKQEPTAGTDAAFYLTIDELHAVLTSELSTVTTLVRQRRRQHRRDLLLPDPPDTFVGYPPESPAPLPETDALVGLAASSGCVEGTARVLMSPDQAADLRAGEILVAPYADVGWSPLFTVAGGIVTDLGGPLSHASIVAREYGVPSVVNVKNGTRLIRTGDRVVVDGDHGEVRILESAGV